MNKGLPIPGYTDQSDDKVSIVTENKEFEERVLRLIDSMYDLDWIDKR